MQYVLAVDLGGTKVESALVDERGRVVAGSRHREPTGPSVSGAGLTRAISAIMARSRAALPTDGSIIGAAAASAGPIDTRSGTIAPLNLPLLHGVDLGAVVAQASGEQRVALGHDGACLALAESRFGAAAGRADCIGMVVSTGIGGGIVSGGRLLTGRQGNAGHLGQLRAELPVDGDSPRTGTLEDLASGPASVRWARAQGWRGEDGIALGRDARAGRPIAQAAVERSANIVGASLGGIAALLDLSTVVIGGGFSQATPDYHDLVEAAARRVAVLPATAELIVLRPQLGTEAPLVGAACLLLSE